MEKIIFIAKNNPVFKKAMEDECLKQVRDDYNVALEKIIQIDQQTPILPVSEKSIFISLVKLMKDVRPNEMPIIFVPVMESRDPKELSKSSNKNDKNNFIDSHNTNNPNNYITMVDQDDEVGKVLVDQDNSEYNIRIAGINGVYVCSPGTSPGYIINNTGVLAPRTYVNEAIAWETDIWVIGYEEVVSPGNRVASAFDGGQGH